MKSWVWRLTALLAMVLLAACGNSTQPQAESIGHVFLIVVENKSYDLSFGSDTAAPYLGKTLPAQGLLLENYYATSHASLGNYISLISGQGANAQTQADCPIFTDSFNLGIDSDGQIRGSSCLYPVTVPNLADQLRAAGISWKAYQEDMGNDPSRYDPALAASSARPYGPRRCGHAAVGEQDHTQAATASDQYAMRHNPFMYFRSVIDDQAYCDEHVVNLADAFAQDLKSVDRTPAFSFITPNLCSDGHDANCADGSVGGLTGIDRFLSEWVPKILASPAFQKDGLLIITYDESSNQASNPSDAEACCGESGTPYQLLLQPGIVGPGGGRVGAVLISPFIKAGTVSTRRYNHFALLRSVEDIFGLAYLGHAKEGDVANAVSSCDDGQQPCSFGADVYTARSPKLPARPAS